jgi:hypothetical protein
LSILIAPSVFSSVCYNKCENTHLLLITEMQKSTQIWGPLREISRLLKVNEYVSDSNGKHSATSISRFPAIKYFYLSQLLHFVHHIVFEAQKKKHNLFPVSYVDPFADICLDKDILVTILLKSRKHYTGRHIFGCLSWTWDQNTIYQ